MKHFRAFSAATVEVSGEKHSASSGTVRFLAIASLAGAILAPALALRQGTGFPIGDFPIATPVPIHRN